MIHLYCALCIAVHTKHFTIMWGGVSPQPPPVCSIHLDDVTAATVQRRQCAHHTPATGGEERESLRQSMTYESLTYEKNVLCFCVMNVNSGPQSQLVGCMLNDVIHYCTFHSMLHEADKFSWAMLKK